MLPVKSISPHNARWECSQRLVCRCLQVTESELLRAVETLNLRTLGEIRHATGAGGGCTCCHKVLRRYLAPPEPQLGLVADASV